MADNSKDLRLPKGSTILITGGTGYIGSHVVNEALLLGYKVRGTSRSQEKADAIKKVFNDDPNFSTVIVKDLGAEGAFDEAVKGVDAVIHVASDTSFDSDPNKVIPGVVASTKNTLDSAMKEPKIKVFVLTSSSTAACLPTPETKFHLDKNSWDDEAVEKAWAPPPYTEDRSFIVYAASKTEGERAFWKFAEEKKPHFVQIAILPNMNTGRILTGDGGATGRLTIEAYRGKPAMWVDPQYQIDVIDNARVHVIAAIDATVKNERIYTFSVPFNWNTILAALRKVRPNAKIIDDLPDLKRDLSTVDNQRGAELLKKWYGQDGYKSLEQSIKENLEGVE